MSTKLKPGRISYGECRMFTNLSGMSCPMCGEEITPNVGHVCSSEANPPKLPGKKPRKRVNR